jgi:hypothetical protein
VDPDPVVGEAEAAGKLVDGHGTMSQLDNDLASSRLEKTAIEYREHASRIRAARGKINKSIKILTNWCM